MKKIIIVSIIFLILLVGYFLTKQYLGVSTVMTPPPSPSQELTPGEVKLDNVKVKEKITDCAFDGICALVLDNDMKIVTSPGFITPEMMEEFNKCAPKTDISQVEPGAELSIYGIVNENNEILFCEEKYYLEIL